MNVEQVKRDLELFTFEGVAESIQCQQSGNHSTIHNTDHVFSSKPWCYASEQGEAPAAPNGNQMFGCMPLPELYTSGSAISPTHYRDSKVVHLKHGHPGMNIMADITSFELSQTSTGSGSFSEGSTTLDQSDIGLDAAMSGRTTFTEDSESLSVRTDDELTQMEDDDYTQTETEDDSYSSVSTESGSSVSSNYDSDSDLSSTVHASGKETNDPGLFKWYGN
jgi:hypothetical protein